MVKNRQCQRKAEKEEILKDNRKGREGTTGVRRMEGKSKLRQEGKWRGGGGRGGEERRGEGRRGEGGRERGGRIVGRGGFVFFAFVFFVFLLCCVLL